MPHQPQRPDAPPRRAGLLLTGLVLGGLGVGSWELLMGDSGAEAADRVVVAGTADPEAVAVAERFAALLQQAEDQGERAVPPDALRPVVCDVDMIEIEQAFAELSDEPAPAPNGVYSYVVTRVETTTSDGTVALERRDRGSGAVETQDALLVKEVTGWQVCGLSGASEPTR